MDPKSIEELGHARNVLEHELAISQCVKASTLEDIKLGAPTDPRTLKLSKELASNERATLVGLLTEYQDVFSWLDPQYYHHKIHLLMNDMKGLDPQYYHHKIHLQHAA